MGKIKKKDLEEVNPCKVQTELYQALDDLGVQVGSYSGFHKSCFASGNGAKKKGGLWHLNVQWAWSNLKDADTGQALNGDEHGDIERYNKARADREEIKVDREGRQNALEQKRVIDKRDVYPMVIDRLVALQKKFYFTWEQEVESLIDAAGGDPLHKVELQNQLNEITKGVFSAVFGKKEEVKITIEAALKKEIESQ